MGCPLQAGASAGAGGRGRTTPCDGTFAEQVAGRLTLEHGRTIISHEFIYRFIYHRARQHDASWYRLLPRAKHRRGRLAKRGGSLAERIKQRVPIAKRPALVAARTEPGHWEADLMIFGRKARALLVLHERISRFTTVQRLPDKTAATVRDRLVAFFQALPKPCAAPSPSTTAASSPFTTS